jgi:hypothetical protein
MSTGLADDIDVRLWEIAENLHRVDLTKDERDRHIRRYAELLEQREREATKNPVPQSAAMEIGYKKPPPRKKGVARQIADATGLSDDTVRRALNPKQKGKARAFPSWRPSRSLPRWPMTSAS